MKSFWSYKNLQKIPQDFRLTLQEGNTPLISARIDQYEFKIKDENHNPNGSFKDRSLAFQISYHVLNRVEKFVISSSGNAAISAAAYVGLAGKELDIFVSPDTNPKKIEKIEKLLSKNIRMHVSLKAKSDAIQFARQNDALNLRGSQDPQAIIGFETIAYELADQYPEIDALFIPCSSGTSTIGIAKGFASLRKKVAIFVCQTSKIHPIGQKFDRDFVVTPKSNADAITDRVALRKKNIIEVLEKTNGGAFVINDAFLEMAKNILEQQKLFYSYNSLLGVAGLIKALHLGNVAFKNPVCLASGL